MRSSVAYKAHDLPVIMQLINIANSSINIRATGSVNSKPSAIPIALSRNMAVFWEFVFLIGLFLYSM